VNPFFASTMSVVEEPGISSVTDKQGGRNIFLMIKSLLITKLLHISDVKEIVLEE
jgi:hypothetical protein